VADPWGSGFPNLYYPTMPPPPKVPPTAWTHLTVCPQGLCTAFAGDLGRRRMVGPNLPSFSLLVLYCGWDSYSYPAGIGTQLSDRLSSPAPLTFDLAYGSPENITRVPLGASFPGDWRRHLGNHSIVQSSIAFSGFLETRGNRFWQRLCALGLPSSRSAYPSRLVDRRAADRCCCLGSSDARTGFHDGYVYWFHSGGIRGVVNSTVGIFLPVFLLVAVSGSLVPRIRRSKPAGTFLDGVNVASLALKAAVTWELGRASLVDALTVLLAVASLIALLRFRVNSAWLVFAGPTIGLIMSAVHLR
jgi:Chromate transporter